MKASRLECLLTALILEACSNLQVRPHVRPLPRTDGPSFPADMPDDSASVPRVRRGDIGGTRRACRSTAIPNGWVIVDYYAASNCPSLGEEQYSGMVLVFYGALGRGASLKVCADQRLPVGWRTVPPRDELAPDQCRSSVINKPVGDRVIEIEKR